MGNQLHVCYINKLCFCKCGKAMEDPTRDIEPNDRHKNINPENQIRNGIESAETIRLRKEQYKAAKHFIRKHDSQSAQSKSLSISGNEKVDLRKVTAPTTLPNNTDSYSNYDSNNQGAIRQMEASNERVNQHRSYY